MKQRSTHQSSQQQSEENGQQFTPEQRQEAANLEFNSVEEMLRHDAAQTTVPPEVAERLLKVINENNEVRPWWRRIFSKGS